jgi:hypothetical protein
LNNPPRCMAATAMNDIIQWNMGSVNVLFERNNLRYFLISAGYWVVSFALMGGILCFLH